MTVKCIPKHIMLIYPKTEQKIRTMGKWTYYVNLSTFLLNVIVFSLSLAIMACGLFLLLSNQGGISPSFFNFSGSIFFLFSFITGSLSMINIRVLFIIGKRDGNFYFCSVTYVDKIMTVL